jgi:outer membrane protein
MEQPEKILTLEDSLKWAMTNNQNLLSLLEKKYVSEQRIAEADSYFYPKLYLTGAYTRLDVSTPTTLPPELGGSSLAVGVSNHYAARASVNQYLFAGGALVNQHLISVSELDQVKQEYEETRRQVILGVASKFYDVIYQQQLLDIYREALQQLKGFTDLAAQKSLAREYEKGLLAIEQVNLGAQISTTEEQLSLAQTAFNKAVGFELNSKVKLVGDFRTANDGIEQKDLNTYVAQALDAAPGLRRMQLEEDKIQYKISQAFSGRYPTVQIGADYEFSGPNLYLEGRNWTATVAVQYPLFNGWLSWARVRQMRGESRLNNLQMVQLQDDLTLMVEQSYAHYYRTGKNLDILLKNKDLAQKTLDGVGVSYKNNQASCGDMLLVLQKYVDTRILYLRNSYEYTLSEIELKVNTGLDPVK